MLSLRQSSTNSRYSSSAGATQTTTSKMMDVKSKIASFEAHNEHVIRTSPDRLSNSSNNNNTNNNAGRQSPTINNSNSNGSSSQDDIPLSKSTTSLASQNRRSRLQRAMNGKHRQQQLLEPGSLMQKRMNDKQRRLENVTNSNNNPINNNSGSNRVPSPTFRHQNHGSVQTAPSPASPYQQQQRHLPQQYPVGTHASPPPSSVSRTRSPSMNNVNTNNTTTTNNNNNLHSPSPSNNSTRSKGNRSSSSSRGMDMDNKYHNNNHHSSNNNNNNSNSSRKSTTSRYQKLKMKEMDQAKLAQKRREVAESHGMLMNNNNNQAHSRTQPQQQQQQHTNQRPAMMTTPTRNRNSPAHNRLQESPDHATLDTLEDDDTLTSVRQIVDQEPPQQQHYHNNDSSQYPQQKQKHQQQMGSGKAPWIVEEKSDKVMSDRGNVPHPSNTQHQHHHAGEIYLRPSSSSEFEPEVSNHHRRYGRETTDQPQTPSPQHQYLRHQQQQQYSRHQEQQQHSSSQHRHHSNSHMNSNNDASGMRHFERSGGSYTRHFHHSSSGNRLDDDERTFDYGVKDDDSQEDGSATFQRQLMEAEMKTREQSTQFSDSASMDQPESVLKSTSNLLSEDMDHVRERMDSPAMKTAASVIGAATLGCIVIGPVGMLLGAAAVGIGVGVMQIPEEQRSNMVKKASEAMAKVEESAYAASETLSSSCANTYKDSGIAEHIPAEMKFCAVSEDDIDHAISPDVKSEDSEAVRLEQMTSGGCGGEATLNPQMQKIMQDARKQNSPNNSRSLRSKKVACLRHVRIVPVSQIHSLEPGAQPRAWLDVLASSGTTHDEKVEAMEEILILAKDKQRAKIFLEEGILDSLMWTLSRYFEKLHRKPTDQWAHPDISPEERNAARLAATCCVTLGKSHCAMIHTEGDLLLMSLYERGTVPEERQLAQCLYEIPHHARITKTNDPTVVDPSSEVFCLKQLTLPQAEELARSIKELADSR